MNFDTLGLQEPLLRALTDSGYTAAMKSSRKAISPALEGKDMMVSASTGSGKTAAFVLPRAANASCWPAPTPPSARKGRGLRPAHPVLAPTRELAMQVDKPPPFTPPCAGAARHQRVGGVPYGAQLKALRGPLAS